ncbi:unnamed protein product [Ceratitis capitata]|uniref:(Mediterranean fruit fly) hypothetical protein n=1 Tax=Ceratitis capitata TaxID=7213 RepID=A0A811VGC3_CERCA|nr:unnamed protein product [Ceratitis capitata]
MVDLTVLMNGEILKIDIIQGRSRRIENGTNVAGLGNNALKIELSLFTWLYKILKLFTPFISGVNVTAWHGYGNAAGAVAGKDKNNQRMCTRRPHTHHNTPALVLLYKMTPTKKRVERQGKGSKNHLLKNAPSSN